MHTPPLRVLLILGRVSNLPTVWSNCLAGWLLGGGGSVGRFLLLSLGATLVYTGGMFLNDAFDADFDAQHRPERPIPSAWATPASVWWWGSGLLGGGTFLLSFLGDTTAILAILLTGLVLIYDAVHKVFTFSPVLMAGCRFLLYLVAASAARQGITGLALWSAIAMWAYVLGLSALARREILPGPLQYGPLLFLGAPVLLALLVNAGRSKTAATVLILALVTWIVRSLMSTRPGPWRNVGRAVSGLLAGIVLVDWLAVCDASFGAYFLFLLLFILALAGQRFVPAT